MRTETLILSGAVPAPINRVFDLMTDPGKIPDWLPRCSNVDSEGPLKKGSRVKVNFNGRATQFEIVDLTPPTTFGWADRQARVGSRRLARLLPPAVLRRPDAAHHEEHLDPADVARLAGGEVVPATECAKILRWGVAEP